MGVKITVVSFNVGLKTAIRRELTKLQIEVDTANNIEEVPSQMSRTRSNVIILDLDMFTKTGTYLKNIVEKYHALIIGTGSNTVRPFDLYGMGITEFIIKPDSFNTAKGTEYIELIADKALRFERTMPKPEFNAMMNTVDCNETIITIASSTGGTEALYAILPMLPAAMPPILIVQHMPKVFTRLFAERLDKSCALTVKEAETEEYIKKGTVYIAPGDFHMTLIKKGSKLAVQCKDGEKVHGVKPSADVLFNSVAPIMKNKVIGVILTGMGSDGAKGLYNMRLNGSYNIGQSKETCVVYGMPKAAYELGSIHIEMPLKKIPEYLVEMLKGAKI